MQPTGSVQAQCIDVLVSVFCALADRLISLLVGDKGLLWWFDIGCKCGVCIVYIN
jgi:hypothetical protein